VILILNKK